MPVSLRIAALAVVGSLLWAVGVAHAVDLGSPRGVWTTFDDKTGKAQAVVRIYDQSGKLFGRIERTLTDDDGKFCVPCKDERKGQPIVGLVIIRNMMPDGDGYSGGDILDPESGSVYRCLMHLEKGGTRLVLRGYIGISLLGRSQTWERAD